MSYGVFARYYDALTKNVDYHEKARYLGELMKKHKPGCSLIVDLACGTGTLSVELAKLGFDVIGVDSSADMLSAASQKPHDGVLFLRQTAQRLDLFGTVDAVLCTLDSVNHITDPAALEKAFARVALFLEDDGVFIFDANTPYKHERVLGANTFVYDLEDIYCVWQNSPLKGGMTEITLDFFERQEDGGYQRSGESFTERAYPRDQLAAMLERSGLYIAEEYGDYTVAPPSPDEERTVYVCRKKGK